MLTDDELVARWDAGESMTAIAASYGLTKERIRQRLKRRGRSGPNRNALPSATSLREKAALSTSLGGLARRLKVTTDRLGQALDHRGIRAEVLATLLGNRRKELSERRLADQRPQVLKIRELAQKLGHTPGQNELAPSGIYHVTLNCLFGSVGNAMIAAGLEPNERGQSPKPLPAEFGRELEATEDEQLLERRAAQLRRSGLEAPPKGNEAPPKVATASSVYVRDPAVVAWVRDDAAGYCEACGAQGYETDSGVRYLEVHHVVSLSDGGPDTISNAVAVCETCHGKLHRWKERATMTADLYSKVARLVRPNAVAAAV